MSPGVEGLEQLQPQPPPLPPPFPGFLQAVGLFALWIGVSLVVLLPFFVIDQVRGDHVFATHPASLGLATIASSVSVLAVARRQTGRSWRVLWNESEPVPLDVLWFGSTLIFGLLMFGVLTFLWLERGFPGIVPKLEYGFGQSRLIAFLVIVVIAPICEETVFRGVFLRGFVERYGFAKGLMLSALLFAVAHGSPARIPHTFALGCALGWLYHGTRSLWVSIAAHALNNLIAGIAILAGLSAGSSGPRKPAPPFHPSELGLAAFALLAIGLSIWRLSLLFAASREGTPPPPTAIE